MCDSNDTDVTAAMQCVTVMIQCVTIRMQNVTVVLLCITIVRHCGNSSTAGAVCNSNEADLTAVMQCVIVMLQCV